MDNGVEIPCNPMTKFADLAKNPRAYFGYAATAEEAEEVVHQFEIHTSSKYIFHRHSKCYGLPVKGMKGRLMAMLFSVLLQQ